MNLRLGYDMIIHILRLPFGYRDISLPVVVVPFWICRTMALKVAELSMSSQMKAIAQAQDTIGWHHMLDEMKERRLLRTFQGDAAAVSSGFYRTYKRPRRLDKTVHRKTH